MSQDASASLPQPGSKVAPGEGYVVAGKPVRELSDEELATHVNLAKQELNKIGGQCSQIVQAMCAVTATVNVMLFEQERRARSIVIASGLLLP